MISENITTIILLIVIIGVIGFDWFLSNGEEDNSTYLQIISEKATKIGVGFANSMSYYYVVAKYDSIY